VLNDRETELLACLDMGLLYKEIEARLHLSHAALRKRQHRLYVKLGAQNRTEALNRWREKRLEETNETSTLSTRKARACVEMPAAGAPRQTLNHASFLHANLLA
jgi:DNA-binding CsgD family transcriptional regulator